MFLFVFEESCVALKLILDRFLDVLGTGDVLDLDLRAENLLVVLVPNRNIDINSELTLLNFGIANAASAK